MFNLRSVVVLSSLSLIVSAFFHGCGPINSDETSVPTLPVREAGEVKVVDIESSLTLNDLNLQVDITVASPNGSVFDCSGILPDGFAVGRAVCAEDTSKVVEILAENVNQICGSMVDSNIKPASKELSLDCAKAEVFSYNFDTNIQLKAPDQTK